MKIAAVGDFHIPSRAKNCPEQLKKKLIKEKPDLILCTGDLTIGEVFQNLSEIAHTIVVKGNMDKINFDREYKGEFEGVKIGLIHGDVVSPTGIKKKLLKIATKMGVNVLIYGHTHLSSVNYWNKKKIVLINPGSFTGAWSEKMKSIVPSFTLLKIENPSLTVTLNYISPSDRDSVKEEKKSFQVGRK